MHSNPSPKNVSAPTRLVILSHVGFTTGEQFSAGFLADVAERLRAAGVPCEALVVEGAFHGFDSIRPDAEITHQFRAAQAKALAPALAV